ncbi:MAG: CcmD family protein, partial [Candidatus Poribacteria bacterium]|nr:CcmD family protein [Candidatus Poribacteria bacterium]
MKIAVLVSFLAVLILFFFLTQVPITLTSNEVEKAVAEAVSASSVPVDEDIVAQAVQLSVAKLEKGQSRRLKYLASAYLVIWLVFVLYVLQLDRQQQELDKRLAQLEQDS